MHETVFNNIKNWKTIANHGISQWLNQYFSMYETCVNMLHTSIISITVVFQRENKTYLQNWTNLKFKT